MFKLSRGQWKYWNTANLEIGPLFLAMTTTRGKLLPWFLFHLRISFERGNTDV